MTGRRKAALRFPPRRPVRHAPARQVMAAALAAGIVGSAGLAGALVPSGPAAAAPDDDRPVKVAGASSPVGAPRLRSGEYVDAIAAGRPRYYTVNLPAGVTPYLTATLVRPPRAFGEGIEDRLEVGLETAAGEPCGSTYETGDQSEHVSLVRVPVRLAPTGPDVEWSYPFSAEACGKPGKYVVRVDRARGDDPAAFDEHADTPLPLHLTVLVEPPADTTGLPAPARTVGADDPDAAVPPAPDFTGNARAAAGGTHHADAPVLSPGVFGDEIAPGETLYWKVRLDWGQQVSYGVRFGPTAGDSSATVRTRVENRLRTDVGELGSDYDKTYDGDPDQATVLRNHTVAVRYANRRAPENDEVVRPVHLAGWYYLVVRMEADEDLADSRVPVQLAVTVAGTRSGVPAYRNVPDAASPELLLAGSDGVLGVRPRTAALVAGGFAALLTAVLLVAAPWLQPRRWRR